MKDIMRISEILAAVTKNTTISIKLNGWEAVAAIGAVCTTLVACKSIDAHGKNDDSGEIVY